jgi:hypothetical protein
MPHTVKKLAERKQFQQSDILNIIYANFFLESGLDYPDKLNPDPNPGQFVQNRKLNEYTAEYKIILEAFRQIIHSAFLDLDS